MKEFSGSRRSQNGPRSTAVGNLIEGKATMNRLSAAIAIVLVTSAPCLAQNGGWVVRGVGSDSCAKFLAAVKAEPGGAGEKMAGPKGQDFFDAGEVYAGWLQGYITGLNSVQPPGSRQIAVDYTGVRMWIANWCQSRPANRLYEAAAAFARSQWQSLGEGKP